MSELTKYWVRDRDYLYTPLQSVISDGSITVYLATDVEVRDRELIEYIKSMENCSTWVDLAHVRKALLARLAATPKEGTP